MRTAGITVDKILSTGYHRNGVGGMGFTATVFEAAVDGTKRRMLAVDFGPEADKELGQVAVAVLDLDVASENNVRFGHNSWRGDHFSEPLREAVDKEVKACKHPTSARLPHPASKATLLVEVCGNCDKTLTFVPGGVRRKQVSFRIGKSGRANSEPLHSAARAGLPRA